MELNSLITLAGYPRDATAGTLWLCFLAKCDVMWHTFLFIINLQITTILVYIPFDNWSPTHHTTPVQMITIPVQYPNTTHPNLLYNPNVTFYHKLTAPTLKKHAAILSFFSPNWKHNYPKDKSISNKLSSAHINESNQKNLSFFFW